LSNRLRRRSWRDTAADFVSIVEGDFVARPTSDAALVGHPTA
jgi:hypothetical protein